MRLTKSLIVLGVAGIAAGCSSGGNGFSSGVPPTKVGSAVTPAEAKQLCEATINYTNQQLSPEVVKPALCKLLGAFTSAFAAQVGAAQQQMVCQQTFDQCMMAPLNASAQQELMQDPVMECGSAQSPGATCTATVAEYEACVTDGLEALHAALNALPACDQLIMMPSSGQSMQYTQPASCTAFEMKCPGLAPDFSGFNLADLAGAGALANQ